MDYYSNGKLLITAEYLVLDGAVALALPTKFGQNLQVTKLKESQIIWESYTNTGECWFKAIFDLPKLRLVNCSFISKQEGSAEYIAETLLEILQAAKSLNPIFLKENNGYLVKTSLTFPRDWGLGTSSTLINSIANWAQVDAFLLLQNSFKGSGYDIACAQNNTPIFYQLKNNTPKVTQVNFMPSFKENLFFIHLNKKQDSKEGIKKFRESKHDFSSEISTISAISKVLAEEKEQRNFDKLLLEHEQIISSILKTPTVKDQFFKDYFGEIKSLGAWGGDFVLATGNNDTPKYFKNKGFNIVLRYDDMIYG